ncbi:MAG TPA: PP2C family protein-serine/threonine phosphatase [Candidatus Acidoferrales bacterium]|nr:PP2C family protein-serine/threonine phosphatase [Candidatus Acidoferrales bacterium]
MSTAKSYWRTVPRRSVVIFLLGVFFIFSTIGFINDILQMGRQPTLRFVLGVLLSGLFATFYAASGIVLRKQFWKAFVPVFVLHFILMNLLGWWLPSAPQPAQMGPAEIARLHSRLALNGLAMTFAVFAGYTCFVYVTVTEGRRYFRVHAEMELATEIHRVLVPAIDTRIGDFEFYGRSSPSGEVGGDLIDVAASEGHWVAYVADVSGHGVAPGVVMGMVKSAARMLLSSGDDTARLLPRLNEVLYPLKKPDMFVTFCFLAKNGDALRVGIAGHPAMLHFSARTGAVTPWESPNMPVGILPSGDFVVSDVQAEPGDIFALYTDGLLEVANAAGEEFGLKRLLAGLQKYGQEPLETICRSLEESVARHGAQSDDQSILLIRRCPSRA